MDLDLSIFDEFLGIVNFATEPDYSRGILEEFQYKYGITTSEFVWLYETQGFKEDLDSIIPEGEDWLFYYEQFLQNGGLLQDLTLKDSTADTIEQLQIMFDNTLDDIKGGATCSSFYIF